MLVSPEISTLSLLRASCQTSDGQVIPTLIRVSRNGLITVSTASGTWRSVSATALTTWDSPLRWHFTPRCRSKSSRISKRHISLNSQLSKNGISGSKKNSVSKVKSPRSSGMRRWFFGRRNDQDTLREAVAFEPQSVSVEILNRVMLNVWRANIVQLLLQVHDSILFQYPEEQEDEILPKVLKLFEYPVRLRGDRVLVIPAEVKTGWNWAPQSDDNPQGLSKWKMVGANHG